jgi:hypothetical protein
MNTIKKEKKEEDNKKKEDKKKEGEKEPESLGLDSTGRAA